MLHLLTLIPFVYKLLGLFQMVSMFIHGRVQYQKGKNDQITEQNLANAKVFKAMANNIINANVGSGVAAMDKRLHTDTH